MKRSRFTEEQVNGILKAAEPGAHILEFSRRHGLPRDVLSVAEQVRRDGHERGSLIEPVRGREPASEADVAGQTLNLHG
jgi:transcription initiation factor TFIIIB Brf1 subunit/transcription initiation factor TFIIB